MPDSVADRLHVDVPSLAAEGFLSSFEIVGTSGCGHRRFRPHLALAILLPTERVGHPAIPSSSVQPNDRSERLDTCWRQMLFKVAVVILLAWFVGLIGLFNAGGFTHVPLLVGLMLLLLAVLRARDAALRRTGNRRVDES